MDDYSTERENIARRQAIADALATGSLAPIQGGNAGGLGVLAKLGQAYFSKKASEKLMDERKDLKQRQLGDLRTGLENFYRTSEGYEAPVMAMQPDAAGNQPTRMIAGDQKKAIMDALASGNPMLQSIATAELKKLGEGALTAEKLSGMATPESVLANPTNPKAWQPKRDLKSFSPGEVILDASGRPFSPETVGGKPAYETVNVGGDLYQRTPTGLKKLDNAPKISTTVNLPKGESKFDEIFGSKEATRLSSMLELRPLQIDGLNAINNGKQLLRDGIFTGIYANVGKSIEKLAAPLMEQSPEKAARTEQFIAYIGDVVIPRLKDFGGSDTVEELRYLQKVMAGDVTMEANSLQRVLDSSERKLRRKLSETDRTVEAYQSRGYNLPTIDLGVPAEIPPTGQSDIAPGAVSGQPIPLDEYLKRMRGGQ